MSFTEAMKHNEMIGIANKLKCFHPDIYNGIEFEYLLDIIHDALYCDLFEGTIEELHSYLLAYYI